MDEFAWGISTLIVGIVIHVLFMLAVFRRVFCPADRSSLIPSLVMLLLFKLAVPVLFFWGWIRSQRFGLTRVMMFWTIHLLSTILAFRSIDSTVAPAWLRGIAVISLFLLIAWFGLVPHVRLDEALRSLICDPSSATIDRVVKFGPAAVPELERLLETDDPLLLEAIIESLARLGEAGRQGLVRARQNANPEVATAAAARLSLAS